MFEECFGEGPFVFRMNDSGAGPALLIQVCLERGWREFNIDTGDHWNLWWRSPSFPTSHHRNLYAWQYINHVPKASSICRKDNLIRNMRCMKKIFGAIYDFSPDGYNLPSEYTKLAAECNKIRIITARDENDDDEIDGSSEETPVWICKPVAQSQGRGIFLFRKLSELNYDTNTVVQRYIEKPLLIGGYKFDLRLYVCIPSYHPLTIYMYREGLVRFGTDKFSLNDLRNPFRHLTNSSINKLGPGYAEMKDRIGSGCKWTLQQLRRYFQQARIIDWLVWQRIVCLVVLTLLSHVVNVPHTSNCFDLFGFDVLIDSALKPWLLEVNLSPALGNDCDADRTVKKPMLHDMFDLLGLPLYNTGLSVFHLWNDDCKENAGALNVMEKSHILNAAGRWRKRQHLKATNLRPKSSSRSKQPRTPKIVKSKSHDKPELIDPMCKKWGNGRNWSNAPDCEGGWVKICPLNADRPNLRQTVAQIVKFNKIAKETAKNHPTASECQLNEFLMKELDIVGELWIPPV